MGSQSEMVVTFVWLVVHATSHSCEPFKQTNKIDIVTKKKSPLSGYKTRIAIWSSVFLLAMAGYLLYSPATDSSTSLTGLFVAEPTSCHTGERGEWGYCSESCMCYAGEGDCDSDWDCIPGTVCVPNVGETYGYDRATDVCMLP